MWGGVLASINSNEVGITPRVGSVASGGGLAIGAHVRQPLGTGQLFLDTEYLASVKGYQSGLVELSSKPLAGGRVTIGGGFKYDSLPQEDFFGYGPDSQLDRHTSYQRQGLDTRAWVAFTPRPWLEVRTTVGHLNTRLFEGEQGGVPSIDTVSWHSGIEGIGRQSNYLHADIDATVDLRDDDFMPRAGTYARVGVSRFSGLGVQDCNFVRTHVDVRHYVPVAGFSGADSIAIRGALSMTASGNARPSFYFLPRLGGGSTLRGYETSRFVDAQAMLVSAEYRWQVRRKLQIVGFVDAGQVAPAMSAFAMSRFDAAGGAGIRYRGFRVDYAVGREGSRFHVGFGPTF